MSHTGAEFEVGDIIVQEGNMGEALSPNNITSSFNVTVTPTVYQGDFRFISDAEAAAASGEYTKDEVGTGYTKVGSPDIKLDLHSTVGTYVQLDDGTFVESATWQEWGFTGYSDDSPSSEGRTLGSQSRVGKNVPTTTTAPWLPNAWRFADVTFTGITRRGIISTIEPDGNEFTGIIKLIGGFAAFQDGTIESDDSPSLSLIHISEPTRPY